MTTEEKVEKARKTIEKKFYRFPANFDRLYAFTTESISGYLPYFELKDRSLLTVGSSGDQVMNAIYSGCKDITVVDVCPFTKEYYEFKKAALLSLTRGEFMQLLPYERQRLSFRKKEREKPIDKDLLKKVEEALSEEESFEFWRQLKEIYPPEVIRQRLFSKDEYLEERIKRINPYLTSDENYNETKVKITSINPTFIEGDILKTKLNRKFDNIWLSNLFDYLQKKHCEGIENILSHLNENGSILLYYLYLISILGNDVDMRDLFDPMGVVRHFPLESELIAFSGIDSDTNRRSSSTDGIIVYQKKDTR